jgi:hypothetical protein
LSTYEEKRASRLVQRDWRWHGKLQTREKRFAEKMAKRRARHEPAHQRALRLRKKYDEFISNEVKKRSRREARERLESDYGKDAKTPF